MGSRQKRKVISALAFFALCLGVLGSCQKSEDSSDLAVSLSGSDVPLVDAPATSCKTRVSGTSGSDDIPALHMNLGRMTLKWKAPTDTAYSLKVIYVRITLKANGLSETKVVTVASQDLQCIMRGTFQGGEEFIAAANDPTTKLTTLRFTYDMPIGEIVTADATKRTSFRGTGAVLVYALKVKDGEQDVPVIGRTDFRFNYTGIN